LLDPSLISTDFGYPNTLTLQDAAALTGPYTNLSKVGRIANCDYYDGNQLFVEHALSGTVCFFFERRGAFPGAAGAGGADSATLTYTLTVP